MNFLVFGDKKFYYFIKKDPSTERYTKKTVKKKHENKAEIQNTNI